MSPDSQETLLLTEVNHVMFQETRPVGAGTCGQSKVLTKPYNSDGAASVYKVALDQSVM